MLSSRSSASMIGAATRLSSASSLQAAAAASAEAVAVQTDSSAGRMARSSRMPSSVSRVECSCARGVVRPGGRGRPVEPQCRLQQERGVRRGGRGRGGTHHIGGEAQREAHDVRVEDAIDGARHERLGRL
jgi:hypothetical protein